MDDSVSNPPANPPALGILVYLLSSYRRAVGGAYSVAFMLVKKYFRLTFGLASSRPLVWWCGGVVIHRSIDRSACAPDSTERHWHRGRVSGLRCSDGREWHRNHAGASSGSSTNSSGGRPSSRANSTSSGCSPSPSSGTTAPPRRYVYPGSILFFAQIRMSHLRNVWSENKRVRSTLRQRLQPEKLSPTLSHCRP